ncbi:MAG: response regulator [Nitrospiraceae bacterium]
MELERRSVLIVEDEEQVRLLLAVMLERQGYEVTTVVSGLEAVDELRSRQFDVVVADCQSPHLDGMRLMLLVRIMWPHMPVILLSGNWGALSAGPQSLVPLLVLQSHFRPTNFFVPSSRLQPIHM